MKSFQNKLLYPFLFAVYPTVALLGKNIEEIKAETTLRALGISLLSAVAIFWLLSSFLKNRYRAALITGLVYVAFFSYGHVYNLLRLYDLAGLSLGRHRILIVIWITLFGGLLWWILAKKPNLKSITFPLNIVGGILLLFPLLQIGQFYFRTLRVTVYESRQADAADELHLTEMGTAPDIYYIILDAYARDDTLQEIYHLDNRPFLEELESMGFYVTQCSQSNYAQTRLSLASSLNLNYLTELSDEFYAGNPSRVMLTELIHHNAAREALESLGYTIFAFETGFKGTQWEDADIYLSPNNNLLARAQLFGNINPFEEVLINTSAGRLLTDGIILLPQFLQIDFNNPRKIHRDRLLYSFDQLSKIPEVSGPKFVFAHLVTPHPPYVFDPDGEFTDFDLPDDLGYPNQIQYVNKVMIPLLEEILEKSTPTPIIIVQADHGAIQAPAEKRLNILNAYYLPDNGQAHLYESISPVNSFRLIFNLYFSGNYVLLNDVGYFSKYNRPYEFTVVPEQRPECP